MKIFVKAKPSSRSEFIKKIDNLHYQVAVKEPPIHGKANRAITKALAKYFNLQSNQVILVSGYANRQKIFQLL